MKKISLLILFALLISPHIAAVKFNLSRDVQVQIDAIKREALVFGQYEQELAEAQQIFEEHATHENALRLAAIHQKYSTILPEKYMNDLNNFMAIALVLAFDVNHQDTGSLNKAVDIWLALDSKGAVNLDAETLTYIFQAFRDTALILNRNDHLETLFALFKRLSDNAQIASQKRKKGKGQQNSGIPLYLYREMANFIAEYTFEEKNSDRDLLSMAAEFYTISFDDEVFKKSIPLCELALRVYHIVASSDTNKLTEYASQAALCLTVILDSADEDTQQRVLSMILTKPDNGVEFFHKIYVMWLTYYCHGKAPEELKASAILHAEEFSYDPNLNVICMLILSNFRDAYLEPSIPAAQPFPESGENDD